MENLRELLIDELQDIYSAEKQIVKALPKVMRGCESDELKNAISEHLEVTKGQVERLEQVFAELETKAKAKHCAGMEGLLKEGSETMEEEEESPLRDLQIIAAAQRIEHYEISAYGSARALAEQLGLDTAAELLDQTMQEEKEADEKLTDVAQQLFSAVNGAGESEEEEDGAMRKSSENGGMRKLSRQGQTRETAGAGRKSGSR